MGRILEEEEVETLTTGNLTPDERIQAEQRSAQEVVRKFSRYAPCEPHVRTRS